MKLPEATKAFIASLALSGRFRSSAHLWRALMIRWGLWLEGHEQNAIPGFDQCPPDTGKGYPKGMSQASIRKLDKHFARKGLGTIRFDLLPQSASASSTAH